MSVRPLAAEPAAALRGQSLTYPEVGATAGGVLPAPYRHVDLSRTLARRDFRGVVEDLFYYRMHAAAGLGVSASSPRVEQDAVVQLRLGLGPAGVTAPCRVIHVIDETHRAGFAYGTLPGHPESGEELFLLDHYDDGSIRFTVRAFSRPASRTAKLGGPVAGWVQDAITARYLDALDSLSDEV